MKQYIINRDALTECEAFETATADELRVLLAVIAGDGVADKDAIAKAAKTAPARARASLVLWEECGILTPAKKQSITDEFEENIADSTMTAKGAAKTIRQGELGKFMADFAEMTGACALSTEAAKLVSAVYGELGVKTDYMLSLAVYISEKGKLTAKRFFIEAEKLVKRGIDTDEALAEYINEKKNEAPSEWEFRRLIGVYDRTLTKSERSYVKKWYGEFGYSNELVGEAYDLTVNLKGKLVLSYMNKILEGWHESGVKTVPDAEKKMAEDRANIASKARAEQTEGKATKKSAPKKEKPDCSFDIDDVFAKALARSFGTEEIKIREEN